MREIVFCTDGDLQSDDIPTKTIFGWFHRWFTTTAYDGDNIIYAIIEDHKGLIHEVHTDRIKFKNHPDLKVSE